MKNTALSIKNIIKFINSIFPPKAAEKWDNLQLINYKLASQSPKNILVGLDILKSDLSYISKAKTNFIITHHPLWLKKGNIDNGEKIIKKFLLDNKIVFFSLHTQLDASKQGINYQLIKKIPICDLTSFKQKKCLSYVNLLNSITFDKFLEILKTAIGIPYCKSYSSKCRKKISKIAICAGSGYDLVKKINWKKTDIFITGDLKYHDWINAERNGYSIVDIGHEIEQIFGNYLKSLVEKNFHLKITILKSKPIFSTN